MAARWSLGSGATSVAAGTASGATAAGLKGIKIELLGIAIIPLGIAVTTNNFWGYVLGVLGFGVAVVGCFLKDNH